MLVEMYNDDKNKIITNDLYNYFKKTDDYLEKNGYNLESILPLNSNFTLLQEYDSYIDNLEMMSDKMKELCCLATRICKLDVCGIDIISTDISSYKNGVFLELNAGPALGLYRNSIKSVPTELINYVCQDYTKLPIINICGNESSLVNNFISSFFIYLKKYVGSYGVNGYLLNNILKPNKGAKQILMNKLVEIAIFDTTSKIIANEGLFYNYCNSIILDEIQDTTYTRDCVIDEPDNIFKILRVNIDIVRKDNYAILNYDDKNINKLIEICDGSIIFYTINNQNMNNSFRYKTVSFENNNIILYDNNNIIKLIEINKNLNKKDRYNLVASIGGIWSYYDLFNKNNNIIFNNWFKIYNFY